MLRPLTIVVVLLLLAVSVWILYERSENERWRFDHGHRYWSVREVVPMPRWWFESLAHYERLYDGPVDLGLVWGFSIAPNGSYAALERNGLVLLYDRRGMTIDTLAAGDVSLGGYTWDLSAGRLRVSLSGARDTVVQLRQRP